MDVLDHIYLYPCLDGSHEAKVDEEKIDEVSSVTRHCGCGDEDVEIDAATAAMQYGVQLFHLSSECV